MVILNSLVQFGKSEYKELKELIKNNENYIYKIYYETRKNGLKVLHLITDYEED